MLLALLGFIVKGKITVGYKIVKLISYLKEVRGFIKILCRRSVGFFSWAFLVFLMKESKLEEETKTAGQIDG